MATRIVREKPVTRQDWLNCARRFVEARTNLAGASGSEFVAGYVDGFRPVFARPERLEGEHWFVWFVSPGRGKAARVVTELLPGTYCDHEGHVFEHNPEWSIVLGTVTRVGQQPLLTLEMFA